jgi:hypothetical protein
MAEKRTVGRRLRRQSTREKLRGEAVSLQDERPVSTDNSQRQEPKVADSRSSKICLVM